MKRSDLMKELRRVARERGVEVTVEEGGNHTKVHLGEQLLVIPRHREIHEFLARKIVKDARGEK